MKFYKNKKTKACIPSTDSLSNENYIEIKAGTEDAALEKHVPVYSIKDDEILVTVGSIDHPMTDEHYIMWIAQIKDEEINKVDLTSQDKPQATFKYIKGSNNLKTPLPNSQCQLVYLAFYISTYFTIIYLHIISDASS